MQKLCTLQASWHIISVSIEVVDEQWIKTSVISKILKEDKDL